MVSLIRVFLILVPMLLAGCTEVKTVFSVLWGGATSLSTSAYEIDEMRSGSRLTCSILGNKTLRCIGSGEKGNLGRFNGAPVSELKEIKQIALGKDFTCVIAGAESSVFCFGSNEQGQLGVTGIFATTAPLQIPDPENTENFLIQANQITAGEKHACALFASGRAICWGSNELGQLGSSDRESKISILKENDRSGKKFQGIRSIVAGANSTCVIAKEENSVFCFGERYGSVQKENWNPSKVEISGSLGSLSNIQQVGLGRGFGCALGKSSQVYCWGRNDLNQLGTLRTSLGSVKAAEVKISFPEEAPISNVEKISVGDTHACALHREEKTVYCWGDNRYGQLGNTSLRGLPEQVALGSNNLTLKGVRELSAGNDRTCIISSRDEVFCWGNGVHGVLGSEKVASPYPIRALDSNGEMLANAAKISVGHDHVCVVDLHQKLYCFGVNSKGQLGSIWISGEVLLAGSTAATRVNAIDTQGFRTCMIHGEDQRVSCFGDREIENVNQKQLVNSFVPIEVKNGMFSYRGAMGVSVGKNHVCVITAQQQIECLGDGLKGQLGSGQGSQALKFGIVQNEKKDPLTEVWQVKSRNNWNCVIRQERGSIWCWGDWKNNQWLTAKPLELDGRDGSNFIQMSLSEDQVCGIHGVNRGVYCTSPEQKNLESLVLRPVVDDENHELKNMVSLSGGKHHFCALDEAKKIWCWGSNVLGQLGLKETNDWVRPTQIKFKDERLKKIVRISAGDFHTCVTTKDDAALFCFGENFFSGKNSREPMEYPL